MEESSILSRTSGQEIPLQKADESMRASSETASDHFGDASRSPRFIEHLSPEVLSEFESLKVLFSYPGNTVLFAEEQTPSRILLLLEGQVKLSINSSSGKRLILGIASPGETLGLASALSGSRCDIRAETQGQCRIASLRREDFLDFLTRHPSAYKEVARVLCLNFSRACEQLRILGLAETAPAKLARLLLDWCADGKATERGPRLFHPLTHGEIGECIGASRETVTHILNDFKDQELLKSRGSTLIICNREALEVCAGIARISNKVECISNHGITRKH
jgi:CRP/FNR family transcriptional regulator, cyclic AMP receptor protein